VFLPGDSSKFAPLEGMFMKLVWKNELCFPVIADFDVDQKLMGWDEGPCGAGMEADIAASLPPADQYTCADARRGIYCQAGQ
jgi:hypothetical protein